MFYTEETEIKSDEAQERLKAPEWKAYIFVLDRTLNFTPYIVSQGGKFYKVNIWTLAEQNDKWFASPRVTTQITSSTAKSMLTTLLNDGKYKDASAYIIPFSDKGILDLDDLNVPLETVLADCVMQGEEDNSFIRPSCELLAKIRSRFQHN